MSIQSNDSQIDQVVLPSVRDLGDFQVRRALPSAHRRMVGPFIFLDSFGPAVFREGAGVDTRPHPHIGLATLTYLIEGEMDHRDSEGYVQTIRPGEVNLMTAGRGIVHSEHSGPEFRAREDRMFGFQAWVARWKRPIPDSSTSAQTQFLSSTSTARRSGCWPAASAA